MARRAWILGATAAALLLTPLVALAGYGQPSPPPPGGGGGGAGEVDANGNPFSGGLGFDPARLRVAVGRTVRWTNTDSFVPHTATEEHGIFDLGGDYGPPGNMGFGPGESVEREFSAGTFRYFCRVHPEMRGVVAAPVKLSIARARKAAPRVRALWSRRRLPAGQAFDVQRRIGGGPWRSIRVGTRRLQGTFSAVSAKANAFRARVRLTDGGGASGYSPARAIRPG